MADGLLTASTWRAYGGDDFPTDAWSIEGDVLHALGSARRISLVSRDEYGDFDLSLEWRLAEGGNSGILYRAAEASGEASETGFEMQLLHNAGHPDGARPETSCGALYDLVAPEETVVCPPGIFNIARVRVAGSVIEHWLNGRRVVHVDTASDEFAARVARSKFRDKPDFGCASRGRIVLQHHGSDVWFRDLRIETRDV